MCLAALKLKCGLNICSVGQCGTTCRVQQCGTFVVLSSVADFVRVCHLGVPCWCGCSTANGVFVPLMTALHFITATQIEIG